MSDNFFIEVLLHFKTRECLRTHPITDNDLCHFYHDQSDMRRELFASDNKTLLYQPILFIPEYITEDKRDSFCQNFMEYAYHIMNYKKKLCPYLIVNKTCERQQLCSYIHPKDNLDCLLQYKKKWTTKADIPFHSFDEQNTEAIPKERKIKYIHTTMNNERAYIYNSQVDFQEDEKHEFKSWSFEKSLEGFMHSLQEDICAFANTNGGTIYIGINEQGHVIGSVCDRGAADKIRLILDQIVIGIIIR